MPKKLITWLIRILAALAIFLPLYTRGVNTNWVLKPDVLANLFPYFGLAAFALLWLHIVGPTGEPWLNTYIDFRKFLKRTSPYIFAFMILHPLVLLLAFGFNLPNIFSAYPADDLVLGIVGIVFLLSFDLGEYFEKRDFVVRHWTKILFISSVGFVIIFFHSLALGSDLQSGFLKYIWYFYGTTGILAILYNYFGKKFIETKKGL